MGFQIQSLLFQDFVVFETCHVLHSLFIGLETNVTDDTFFQGFVAEEFISSGVDGRASCRICGKGFIQKSDAKRHIVAKHSGIEQHVECEYCGKTFKNKQSLGSHARIAHNAYKTSAYEKAEYQVN